jgi:hypothetical protein
MEQVYMSRILNTNGIRQFNLFKDGQWHQAYGTYEEKNGITFHKLGYSENKSSLDIIAKAFNSGCKPVPDASI